MYKLHYFSHYGRAEPIRMLLAHAKIPYDDCRIFDRAEWPGMKPKFEFGQIPVLEVTHPDGKVKLYAQTLSILRYLSIRYGYYPADNAEVAWTIDSSLDSVYDLINTLVLIMKETDPERKAKMTKDFYSGPYPTTMKALSKRLTENSTKFLADDKITTADFLFGHFIFSLIYNDLREIPAGEDYIKLIFEEHEPLIKYAANFKAEFAEYLETRPKHPR